MQPLCTAARCEAHLGADRQGDAAPTALLSAAEVKLSVHGWLRMRGLGIRQRQSCSRRKRPRFHEQGACHRAPRHAAVAASAAHFLEELGFATLTLALEPAGSFQGVAPPAAPVGLPPLRRQLLLSARGGAYSAPWQPGWLLLLPALLLLASSAGRQQGSGSCLVVVGACAACHASQAPCKACRRLCS